MISVSNAEELNAADRAEASGSTRSSMSSKKIEDEEEEDEEEDDDDEEAEQLSYPKSSSVLQVVCWSLALVWIRRSTVSRSEASSRTRTG